MRNSENQIMKGHILLNDESPTELSKDKNLMLNSKSRLRWTITWLTWSKNSTTWFNGPIFLLHSIGEFKTTIPILKNLDNFFIKKVTFVDRLLSKKIQVELSFERWIRGILKFSSQIIFIQCFIVRLNYPSMSFKRITISHKNTRIFGSKIGFLLFA